MLRMLLSCLCRVALVSSLFDLIDELSAGLEEGDDTGRYGHRRFRIDVTRRFARPPFENETPEGAYVNGLALN